MRALSRAAGAIAWIALGGLGCNALLDNERGSLVAIDEAGTLPAPVDPPSGLDAGTSDARSADDGGGGVLDGGGCASGEHLCFDVCVPVDDPAYGCGAPSCAPCTTAHGTTRCESGACTLGTCQAGYADCNRVAADGCEVDLAQPASCGSCTTACPAATPLCAATGTTFACTNGCPADAPLTCVGSCIDPLTNASHCGACGAACPAGPGASATCNTGVCSVTCAEGLGDCDANPANGCEVDLRTSGSSCGACGRSCNLLERCVSGRCRFLGLGRAP